VGYTVLLPEQQQFESPSWRPEEPLRRVVELPLLATLSHSRAHLWRYPPGARGRRHREPVQEEIFCVLEGTLTMLLAEPAERFELRPQSIVVVEPGTALHVMNASDGDVVFFAYGAPHQPADYEAEYLPDSD
jgi:quercetin dioxygenase-like cupin family protein